MPLIIQWPDTWAKYTPIVRESYPDAVFIPSTTGLFYLACTECRVIPAASPYSYARTSHDHQEEHEAILAILDDTDHIERSEV